MSSTLTVTRTGVMMHASLWEPWMDDVLAAKLYDAGAVWKDNFGVKHRGLSYNKALSRRVADGIVFPHGLIGKFTHAAKSHGYEVNVVDGRKLPDLKVDESKLQADFRYKQKEALELLLKADHGIVLCATGYGKSWLIKQLVQVLPTARFAIITPRSEVVREIYTDLVKLIGAKQVGKLCSGTPPTEDRKRVVVSTASSIKRAPLETCDYLLFDEVHGVGPGKTAEHLLERVGHAKMFGFTASLHRGDGGVAIINALFGKPILEVSFQEAVQQKMIVPIKLYMPKFTCNYSPNLTGILAIDERLHYWRNKARNEFIAELAHELPEKAQCLITVKTLEHAIYLHSLLPEYTVIHYGKTMQPKIGHRPWTLEDIEALKPNKCADRYNPEKRIFKAMDSGNRIHVLYLLIDGGDCSFAVDSIDGKRISAKEAFDDYSRLDDGEAFGAAYKVPTYINGKNVDEYSLTAKERAALVNAFAKREILKVISTYTLREGVNIANLEYLIRADGATSNIVNTQFPGRACRLAEGKKQAVLIDLYDTFTPWAKQRSITRLKQYQEKGWAKRS